MLDNFLDPAKRKALYGALAAVSTVLVAFGVATDSVVTGWVGVATAVLDLLALVLASWKAHRWDATVLYATGAAVVGAFKVVGVLDDGAASHALDILAAGVAIIPLAVAFMRTTPATPTGEPQAEYLARHAAVPLNLVEPEE